MAIITEDFDGINKQMYKNYYSLIKMYNNACKSVSH